VKLPWKYFDKLKNDEHVPRWAKKQLLGKKLSKTKLRKLVKTYKEGDKTFCPYCGCKMQWSTNNMASYPERWVKCFCLRCGELVEVSDNSPYYHILDCGVEITKRCGFVICEAW
jgi:hypothetical protein